MTTTQAVDPSISRTPLPLEAMGLPTVCVLCSHNCGLHVDVRHGEIVGVRADETPSGFSVAWDRGAGSTPSHRKKRSTV